jgi:hypothetical protein
MKKMLGMIFLSMLMINVCADNRMIDLNKAPDGGVDSYLNGAYIGCYRCVKQGNKLECTCGDFSGKDTNYRAICPSKKFLLNDEGQGISCQ